MSTILDEDGDVDWKAVIDLLREGKTAEIPCEKERDYVRRAAQVVKRAEKRGIAVEVRRDDGVLRIEPRPGSVRGNDESDAAEGAESSEELERHQRRDARRAERGAERGRDG